jgi:hypothetical protein
MQKQQQQQQLQQHTFAVVRGTSPRSGTAGTAAPLPTHSITHDPPHTNITGANTNSSHTARPTYVQSAALLGPQI